MVAKLGLMLVGVEGFALSVLFILARYQSTV